MLGRRPPQIENRALDLDYVAVKAAQFSFRRLAGADPTLGVEMASTGEVACFGDDLYEALLKSLIATGFTPPKKGILLSVGPAHDKDEFLEYAELLKKMGLKLYATKGTADKLNDNGIECETVYKLSEGASPSTIEVIKSKAVDMVINIPLEYSYQEQVDGYYIRRTAIDHGVSLFTNFQLVKTLINALLHLQPTASGLKIKPWREYTTRYYRG